jgi:hypothetical protein
VRVQAVQTDNAVGVLKFKLLEAQMVKREEIKIGDRLRNNDPRAGGREVAVIAIVNLFSDWYACYQAGRRVARVRMDRIYRQQDINHNKGWTLIPQ